MSSPQWQHKRRNVHKYTRWFQQRLIPLHHLVQANKKCSHRWISIPRYSTRSNCWFENILWTWLVFGLIKNWNWFVVLLISENFPGKMSVQNALSTGLGFAIIDTIISDRKGRFVFWHFWRIVYLGHPIIGSAFLQLKYHLNIRRSTDGIRLDRLTIMRVADAWARICPPTGFLGSATKLIPAPGSAVIWFVM